MSRPLISAAHLAQLNERGFAVLPELMSAAQCARLRNNFARDDRYRSTIDMARYQFGRGSYRYFAYPLPAPVADLRSRLYPELAHLANQWQDQLKRGERYPLDHSAYLKRCHDLGQQRPTPLILRYHAGDYNCLHQDLYGEEKFPLQVAVLLSIPGQDFTGGELVLTEQRPRRQSRVEVVPLEQGQGVVFAVSQRPVAGARGYYQVNMRHGVSRILSGERFTLGIIFHDAA